MTRRVKTNGGSLNVTKDVVAILVVHGKLNPPKDAARLLRHLKRGRGADTRTTTAKNHLTREAREAAFAVAREVFVGRLLAAS